MTIQENRKLVRSFHRHAWEEGRSDGLEKFLAKDITVHMGGGDKRVGYDEVGDMIESNHRAFPDLEPAIKDEIVTEDRVVYRFWFRGTHRGELNGIPPTGREIEAEGLTIFGIEDGRIAEVWTQMDLVHMMQQMGVMPEPAQA
jgi:steroid delta-isomerase-like uncharacterized protein